MSAEHPITNTTIHGHKRPRHTLTKRDTNFSDLSNETDTHDLPHLIPSTSTPGAPQHRPSAQRRADYLASQPPLRQQIVARHLRDFTAFMEEAREGERRSDAYFDIGTGAHMGFRGLSRADKAKMKGRRKMFKSAEVTVSMWKALAQKVFGRSGFD